jgi:xanthine dehydrogenase FAD-binding subunit
MIPKLKILLPKTIEEACGFLNNNNSNAKIIGGGTDIVPGFHIDAPRFKDIEILIDISGIKELKEMEISSDEISIGSAVTFSEIISSPILNKYCPLLVKASKTLGSRQIRNRATIAGNFINNAPCADSVAPFLVYEASVKIKSKSSERIIKLDELLLKPYKTQLQPDELIAEIILPIPSNSLKGDFYKLGRRRAVSISRISLAVLLEADDKIIKQMKIASGAVIPIGKRLPDVEEYANGKICGDKAFKEIAIKLGERILDVSGLRWSSEYKIPVVQQMCYQLLKGIERRS